MAAPEPPRRSVSGVRFTPGGVAIPVAPGTAQGPPPSAPLPQHISAHGQPGEQAGFSKLFLLSPDAPAGSCGAARPHFRAPSCHIPRKRRSSQGTVTAALPTLLVHRRESADGGGCGRGSGRRSRALVAGTDAVGAAGPARARVVPETLAGACRTASYGAALPLGLICQGLSGVAGPVNHP